LETNTDDSLTTLAPDALVATETVEEMAFKRSFNFR
jgi:hypothetical protein